MASAITLEQLLDIESIRQLRVLYSHYFDGKRVNELADLFTDDAICEFGPAYGGDWVGKATIHTNYAKYTEAEGVEFSVMHAVTNHNVRLIDATTAQGRCYLLDLRTAEGIDNPLILFGIYDDVYKKVPGAAGGWKIHRTRIDFLWPKRHYYGPRSV